MLIVSENEVFKPSNTGRLIADTIQRDPRVSMESYRTFWRDVGIARERCLSTCGCLPADYVDEPERLLDGLNPERLKTSDGSDKSG